MSSRSSSSSRSPLSFPGFYCVGYVRSAHGIRGELALKLFVAEAEWLDEIETLNLLAEGTSQLKAFPLLSLRAHKDGFIAQLEGIPSRNESELWKRAQVYIPEELLTSEPGEEIYLREIDGFALVDPSGRVLGQITGFSSNGSQDLLQITLPEGRIALVPFVDAFLLGIDRAARQVRMDLPPGLIDP